MIIEFRNIISQSEFFGTGNVLQLTLGTCSYCFKKVIHPGFGVRNIELAISALQCVI